MSDPYLSEIRIMPFSFAPRGWAQCNGQTMSISQNTALFSLLGTAFGGDGRSTFKLPNLQGMVPIHAGDGFTLGQTMGEATHTLSVAEMPSHTHLVKAKNATAQSDIGGRTPGPAVALAQAVTAAPATAVNIYGTGAANQIFASQAIANSGNSEPHPNQQPYLVLNFCICTQGIFPSQN
jgi:microcystin-dependent protein